MPDYIFSALDLLNKMNVLWIAIIFFVLFFHLNFLWKKSSSMNINSMQYSADQRKYKERIVG
jgi:hypothetical protein